MFFPWFTSRGKATSRNDVLAEKDAVRVKSCWGGMVAFDATPFLRQTKKEDSFRQLKFRHQEEIYWEASECCLIHADIAERTPSPKIFINPYIRVAYDAKSWSWLPFIRRIEHVFKTLQWVVSWIGYPEYNPRRTEIAGETSTQIRWIYDDPSMNGEALRDQGVEFAPENLHGEWRDVREMAKPGGFCGQRRLFVMKPDLHEANEGIVNVSNGRNWEKGRLPS
jgi:hypothetical protein